LPAGVDGDDPVRDEVIPHIPHRRREARPSVRLTSTPARAPLSRTCTLGGRTCRFAMLAYQGLRLADREGVGGRVEVAADGNR
jgi:hypothetical protein